MIFNALFALKVIRDSISVPHVTYRATARRAYCNLHFTPPFFKGEVEGLLELVACDCVLMREWLRGGDKAPSSGWEVLGGIRIIIKKRHVFKKHTMEQGRSLPLLLLHPSTPPSPSLHPYASVSTATRAQWSTTRCGRWNFLSSPSCAKICCSTD